MKHNEITEAILTERFGKDSLIALATVENGIPSVRTVDAVYIDGAFYVVTYALSGKMQQISKNPMVNEADTNTCLLKICLTDAVLFSHGTRYDIEFGA